MGKNSKFIVFFDFDNTIARFDVFDDLIERFATDKRWIDIEERWKRGEIGSKECLEGQLKCVDITRNRLDDYLSRIRLDPYFKRLLSLLHKEKIRTVILSDNFDYMLKRILMHNGIKGLKVYSNKMQVKRDKFITVFPWRNRKCLRCAHCKSKNLLANASQDNIIIYIGDGRSDICPAQKADIIFAKDSLLRFCRSKKIRHVPFNDLKKVYAYFRRNLT